MSKFGGILFSPVRLTAVVCYVSGHLNVRLPFQSQIVPPRLLNPSTNNDIYVYIYIYMSTLLVTAHFSQLTNMALTLRALIIACCGLHCGLKYQHWPMKLNPLPALTF